MKYIGVYMLVKQILITIKCYMVMLKRWISTSYDKMGDVVIAIQLILFLHCRNCNTLKGLDHMVKDVIVIYRIHEKLI